MSVQDHANFLLRLKTMGFNFDVIYDIGANLGSWSTNISALFPDARFELFEPLAGKVRSMDERSMVGNLPNATMHAVALSDMNGMGKIKILGEDGLGSSILVLESDSRKNIEIIDCEINRLDDLVSRKGLPVPDFVKIDAQAAELKILKGARETIRKCKFILLETWMRRVYGPETPLFHEISNWLYQHGYVLYDFLSLDGGRDPDGTLRWFDAVYINKEFSKFPAASL